MFAVGVVNIETDSIAFFSKLDGEVVQMGQSQSYDLQQAQARADTLAPAASEEVAARDESIRTLSMAAMPSVRKPAKQKSRKNKDKENDSHQSHQDREHSPINEILLRAEEIENFPLSNEQLKVTDNAFKNERPVDVIQSVEARRESEPKTVTYTYTVPQFDHVDEILQLAHEVPAESPCQKSLMEQEITVNISEERAEEESHLTIVVSKESEDEFSETLHKAPELTKIPCLTAPSTSNPGPVVKTDSCHEKAVELTAELEAALEQAEIGFSTVELAKDDDIAKYERELDTKKEHKLHYTRCLPPRAIDVLPLQERY